MRHEEWPLSLQVHDRQVANFCLEFLEESEPCNGKRHNAVHKTLCVLSQQVREVRGAVFMCWMIKQEAPEYKKPKEQLRAYSELAATKGKGHGLGPPGIAAFTLLLQALLERERGWSGKPQANEGRHGTGGSIRLGTSLQTGQSVRPSTEPSRTRHQRGSASRTHSWGARTNRSESSFRSSCKRSVGTGTVLCDRTNKLKKVNFVAASRLDSSDRPLTRSADWRKNFASDKELMDRATGKVLGTGGSAVSSTLGQLPTLVEVEEVRELPCGALDLELDAEEDAAREMYSQCDL